MFSSDGTRLLTASFDGTVKDARASATFLQLKGNAERFLRLAYSPDGTRLLTVSHQTAMIWNAHTGTSLLELKGDTEGTQAVALGPPAASGMCSVVFSPDGTRVAMGGEHGTARIWDAHKGVPLLDLKGHTDLVASLAFSPNGTRVATGSWGKTAKIWDARTGALLQEFDGRSYRYGSVSGVGFSRDGKRLGVLLQSSEVKVWDLATSREISAGGDDFDFSPRTMSPDGRSFVFTDEEGVKIVDLVPSPAEREYRSLWTRPRPDLHREEYLKAMRAKDTFAAAFHLSRAGPPDAQLHVDLGTVLEEIKEPDAAIAEYRLAIKLEPQLVLAHKKLGLACALKDDWEAALAAYHQIKILDPENVEVPLVLGRRGRPALTARLLADAFAAKPMLTDDVRNWIRYEAACFAALAANGKKDADKLGETDRAHWRKQALDWLRAELKAHEKQVQSGQAADRAFVQERLKHWQSDSDLVGIRDKEAIVKLPAEEQEACRELWTEVEALLGRSLSKGPLP
jgi:hypothetical protein